MRQVPPGTNGGVSLTGTLAGFGGASVIAITSWFSFLFATWIPRSEEEQWGIHLDLKAEMDGVGKRRVSGYSQSQYGEALEVCWIVHWGVVPG